MDKVQISSAMEMSTLGLIDLANQREKAHTNGKMEVTIKECSVME